MIQVALIDYEMGNLRSVEKALEKVGCSVQKVGESFSVQKYDALVLPGVGAFEIAMQNLKKRKLFKSLLQWLEVDKPFLGICLGYQLLFESSEEGKNKNIPGLGLFKGKVKKLSNKKNVKVPHMGWNQIEIYKNSEMKNKRLTGFSGLAANEKFVSGIYRKIPKLSYFYFDHSYVPNPMQKEIIATITDYGDVFASSIACGKLFASQFHPEKSGTLGLQLLKNFTELC